MCNFDGFVDIHCHLVPGIDDGAKSWADALAMADIAVADGISTVIVTPHQLGNYAHNDGDFIRQRAAELQRFLDQHEVELTVLPGADVRIEDGMVQAIRDGRVVSLADRRRHVLLELPHELYFPLEPLLEELEHAGMVGILSHPERNQGLLQQRPIIEQLVRHGCLMQVTAGSLMGTFGERSQACAEWMIRQGLVHFVATDAHGARARRPLLRRAFDRVVELDDDETAVDLCCRNPAAVVSGAEVVAERRPVRQRSRWFGWRKAG